MTTAAHLAARLLGALDCTCLAALLCLAAGIEAVAHHRFATPAINPLGDFATRAMRVDQRYLQNTVEQRVAT